MCRGRPLPPKSTRGRKWLGRTIGRLLAELFPKAFVVDTKRRFPLKLGIEREIKAHEVELAAGHPVNVDAAVAYYINHADYHRALLAGTARYDLRGERAGTVTETKAIAAQKRIAEIQKMLRERREQEQQQPTTPVGQVLQAIRGPDDQKVPAAPARRGARAVRPAKCGPQPRDRAPLCDRRKQHRIGPRVRPQPQNHPRHGRGRGRNSSAVGPDFRAKRRSQPGDCATLRVRRKQHRIGQGVRSLLPDHSQRDQSRGRNPSSAGSSSAQ